jgi:hypothetical protein
MNERTDADRTFVPVLADSAKSRLVDDSVAQPRGLFDSLMHRAFAGEV